MFCYSILLCFFTSTLLSQYINIPFGCKQAQQYSRTHQAGFISAASWSAQNAESPWTHVHITSAWKQAETTVPCPATHLSILICKSSAKTKQSVISVSLQTHLEIRLGIYTYKTSLLHRPDGYIGFTPSCPSHIL